MTKQTDLPDQSQEKPLKQQRYRFGFTELLLILLILFLAVSVLFQGFIVDGASMLPTYNDYEEQKMDEVLVLRFFYDLDRGDIVILKLKEAKKAYIKRVIALPGDTIKFTTDPQEPAHVIIQFKNGGTWEHYEEDYILEPMKIIDFPLDLIDQEIKVPKNCYFVMGDNRNNSTDSREFGAVEKEELLGKVIMKITDTFWSYVFIDKSVIEDGA